MGTVKPESQEAEFRLTLVSTWVPSIHHSMHLDPSCRTHAALAHTIPWAQQQPSGGGHLRTTDTSKSLQLSEPSLQLKPKSLLLPAHQKAAPLPTQLPLPMREGNLFRQHSRVHLAQGGESLKSAQTRMRDLIRASEPPHVNLTELANWIQFYWLQRFKFCEIHWGV